MSEEETTWTVEWSDLSQNRELPALENPCHCRDGSGEGEMDYQRGKRLPCGACDGAGYIPTPFGRRVLRLMRHNLPSLLRENE